MSRAVTELERDLPFHTRPGLCIAFYIPRHNSHVMEQKQQMNLLLLMKDALSHLMTLRMCQMSNHILSTPYPFIYYIIDTHPLG